MPPICHYTVSGKSGQRPALFLIHGIGAAIDTWRFLLPVLTPHFQVITYDLRGHGNSFIPKDTITLQHLVDDLENLRQHLGINVAHFAGHSLGGMIAPAYAHQYPQHVLSLALLSTAAGRDNSDKLKLNTVINKMEKQGIANVLPTLINRWYTDAFVQHHRTIVEQRLQQVINTDPSVFINVFKIYAQTEMLPWLHQVTAPSLVLTGENDGGCHPQLNQKIADALPYSQLLILPKLKHSILLEAGEIVATHLLNFYKIDYKKLLS